MAQVNGNHVTYGSGAYYRAQIIYTTSTSPTQLTVNWTFQGFVQGSVSDSNNAAGATGSMRTTNYGSRTYNFSSGGNAVTYESGTTVFNRPVGGDQVINQQFWLEGLPGSGARSTANLNVTVPAQSVSAPAAPSNPGVTYVSDSQQDLTFTNNANPPSSPYDSVRVIRAEKTSSWGSFSQINSLAGNTTSATDTGTSPNRGYRYFFRAVNVAGTADSATVDVFTTPAAPSGVTAVRGAGTDIDVYFASNVAYPDHDHLLEAQADGGSWVAVTTLPAGVLEYNDPTPPAGTFIKYRVTAHNTVGSLTSAPVESNTVTVLSPPNPPTGLSPDGGVAPFDQDAPLSWTFNSTDTSPQSAYQIRHRLDGSGTWTTETPVSSPLNASTLPAGTYALGDVVEWQVRAWGSHADPSDWSSSAVFTMSQRPSAIFTSPNATTSLKSVTAAWLYSSPVGSTQAGFTVSLIRGGQALETHTGTTATSVSFSEPLVDGEIYTFVLTVTDSDGLSSLPVETTVFVASLSGFPIISWSVSEDTTPLDSSDSSGSVGQFTAEIALPDPAIFEDDPLTVYGPDWLYGKVVVIDDEVRGLISGKVVAYSENESTVTVTCLTQTRKLNVWVTAEPKNDTVGNVFAYYLSLAGVADGFSVDPSIADTPVVVPGFKGELWTNMKKFVAANGWEIAVEDNEIVLRPARTITIESGNDIDRSRSLQVQSTAQTVEVYEYDLEWIEEGLVYPSGGWTPEVEVLNVNAGETAEYTLTDPWLSASLVSIQEPEMVTFVSQEHDSSSVYTVVADDGLPVAPGLWAAQGGKVTFEIGDDLASIVVKLTGPTGIPTSAGVESKSFSLALASDKTGSRYSTLRIVGTGVRYSKTPRVFYTGLTDFETGTKVGETIDNPFLSDPDKVYTAGIRAAVKWAGVTPSTSVTKVYTNDGNEFGRVGGARLWDERRKRWFRVRSAIIGPDVVNITGVDDDYTFQDLDSFLNETGWTMGDLDTAWFGMTWQDRYLIGVNFV